MLGEEEKRRVLLAALTGAGRGPAEAVGEEALKERLEERMEGGQFDESLFEQLAAEAQKRGQLSPAGFAEVWLDAERRLLDAREGFAERRGELQRQLEELNQQKIAREGTERLNALNVMEGSELTVFLAEVRDILKPNGQPFEASFVLSCEGQAVETEVSRGAPLFAVGKQFRFAIKLGTEPLEVQMIDAARSDSVEGYIKYPLRELRSQEPRQVVQSFTSPYGQQLRATVEMECQWVHSQVKLCDLHISAALRQLAQLEQEQSEGERYLQELVAPFPELRRGARPPAAEKAFLEPRAVAQYGTEERPWNKLPAAGNPSTARFLLYALYAYLLAAALGHLHARVGLDLLAVLLLFGALQLNAPLLNQSFARKCFGALGLAQLLGLARLATLFRPWWGDAYADGLLALRRLSLLFELLLVLARFGALAGLFVALKTLPKSGDEFEGERGQSATDGL